MAKIGKELYELSYVTVGSTVFDVKREGKPEPDFGEVPVGWNFYIFQCR